MNNQENKKEQQARELLESILAPGEKLKAYISGSIAVDFLSKTYHLGLTIDRLVLVPHRRGRQSDRVLSIGRENIQSLKWSGLGGRLIVQLGKDKLQISISKRYWRRRAKDLVDTHNQLPHPKVPLEPEVRKSRIIHQAQSFHDLGFLRTAIAEIEKLQRDPSNAADSEVQQIRQQFNEARLAVRVGAGFLFINTGIGAALIGLITLCGSISEAPGTLMFIVPAAIDIMIGINLWKGTSRQWQAWAVLRAVLGFLFYGIFHLSQGQILDFVLQTTLCASIFIVLTGESNRNRTYLAIGVYGIGYLGLFILSFIIGFIS